MPEVEPGVWEFPLGYRTPPLSLNDYRGHPKALGRKVAALRNELAGTLSLQRIGRLASIRVELHYLPPTRGKRDPINLCATLKVLQDACTPARIDGNGRYPGAGIVADDSPDYLEHVMPIIHTPITGVAGLWCRVVDLGRHPRITPPPLLAAADVGTARLF